MTATAVTEAAAAQGDVAQPDRAWRRFYTAGGVGAALYLLTTIVIPFALTIWLLPRFWEVLDDAQALLPWIADHALGWHVVQGFTLEGAIFAIFAFVGLWLALRHIDPLWSAIAAIVGITYQLLSMAYYPVLLGLAYLGEKYPTVGSEQQRDLVAAAEGLVAQNSGFNPIYEALLAASVFLFSMVMLRGVFPKWLASVGLLTGAAAIAAVALHPILGLTYLFWWVFFVVWFIGVAWYLIKLGMRRGPAEARVAARSEPST
jgi:hypothetical protein